MARDRQIGIAAAKYYITKIPHGFTNAVSQAVCRITECPKLEEIGWCFTVTL